MGDGESGRLPGTGGFPLVRPLKMEGELETGRQHLHSGRQGPGLLGQSGTHPSSLPLGCSSPLTETGTRRLQPLEQWAAVTASDAEVVPMPPRGRAALCPRLPGPVVHPFLKGFSCVSFAVGNRRVCRNTVSLLHVSAQSPLPAAPTAGPAHWQAPGDVSPHLFVGWVFLFISFHLKLIFPCHSLTSSPS